ncbi:TLDc domain-containing protein [Entamoeba marina]
MSICNYGVITLNSINHSNDHSVCHDEIGIDENIESLIPRPCSREVKYNSKKKTASVVETKQYKTVEKKINEGDKQHTRKELDFSKREPNKKDLKIKKHLKLNAEIEKDVEKFKKLENQKSQSEIPNPYHLIIQPIHSYVYYLQKFCNKTNFEIIYNTETHEYNNYTIWSIIKNRMNFMLIFNTTSGNVFGSFHSISPPSLGKYSSKDFNHFVFTLKNPHNLVKKLKAKTLDSVLKISGVDQDNVLVINGFCFITKSTNSFFVSSQKLWRFYTDKTDLGIPLFGNERGSFDIERILILQWY